MNTNRDLSAVARSAKVDDAIDHVAARMTRVDDDPMLASRIVAALPERSAWSLRWLMPRLAITAALAGLAITVVLRTFDEGSTGVGPAEAGHHSVSGGGAAAPGGVGPAQVGHHGVGVNSAKPINVVSAFRRTDSGRTTSALDGPDHEFSLPAIEAVAALDVNALAPANLPEDAPLTVEPLVIADLPMTEEFPVKEE